MQVTCNACMHHCRIAPGQRGMHTILVTNGTASPAVLDGILPWTDAMNIDLKGFREEFYRKLGGSLAAVKDFIRRAFRECHVELTTLIIPGENDSVQEMEEEVAWIASVNPDIPLHITRFFPRFQMTEREATDLSLIYRLCGTAKGYLNDVFARNC